MKHFFTFLAAAIAVGIGYYALTSERAPEKPEKIYWFIPDGLRAEPDMFTVFKWAQEGKLPNIKKMMENGAYGYSIPDFPGHTPVNFASLLTGAHPTVHRHCRRSDACGRFSARKAIGGGIFLKRKKGAADLENAGRGGEKSSPLVYSWLHAAGA